MILLDSIVEAGMELPERERERLWRIVIEYVTTGVEPQGRGAAMAVFTAVRPSLDNNVARQKAGKSGGRPRKTQKQTETKPESKTKANEKQTQKQTETKPESKTKANGIANGKQTPRKTESEDEDEIVMSKDITTPIAPYAQIVAHLNARAGTSFRPDSGKTRRLIDARWHEGFRLPDFERVIDAKCAEWLHDRDMCRYLRPETLFGTKFEGYLNAAPLVESAAREVLPAHAYDPNGEGW